MQIHHHSLQGHWVYLEPLYPSHFEALLEAGRHPRIWEFTRTILFEKDYDSQMRAYLEKALDPAANGGQVSFAVRQVSDGKPIGMSRFYYIEPKDKRLMIGYTWYTPDVWGGVQNLECKYLMLRYAFETARFNRVEFQVAHQNERSQRALERIGAVKEGVLRRHGYRNDGSIRDTVIYSIIAEEWPAVKQGLEAAMEAKRKL